MRQKAKGGGRWRRWREKRTPPTAEKTAGTNNPPRQRKLHEKTAHQTQRQLLEQTTITMQRKLREQTAHRAQRQLHEQTTRRSQRQLHENTQVRQDRQHRCKAIDTLLQHHAVTHTIAIAITTCCSYSRPRVHMHGSNYMAQGQMQPGIAQRTPTWRPDCLPGSAGRWSRSGGGLKQHLVISAGGRRWPAEAQRRRL